MPVFQLANDKYRGETRATYIDDPADSSIQVTAIPANLPTYVTIGWNTDYETLFKVESTSGSSSANYALTGLTKIKGYDGNLPEGLGVNCLNHEEYFNQYSTAINDITVATDQITDLTGDVVGTDDTQTLSNKRITKRVVTAASSATPTPNADTTDHFQLTALAVTAEFGAPTGTPTNGQTMTIRIKDNGTARALTWNAIYRAIGVTLPSTTAISKTLYVGMIYNSADTKWDIVAVQQEI
jgi:hypothetical protein